MSTTLSHSIWQNAKSGTMKITHGELQNISSLVMSLSLSLLVDPKVCDSPTGMDNMIFGKTQMKERMGDGSCVGNFGTDFGIVY
jgi:hypothetical protein